MWGDEFAAFLPQAEQGVATPPDPGQCEAESASRMGVNAGLVYLALHHELQAEHPPP